MTLTADQGPVREENTPNGRHDARLIANPAATSRTVRIVLAGVGVALGWMVAILLFGTTPAHAADAATPPDAKPGLVGSLVSGVTDAVERPATKLVSGATDTVSRVAEKVVAPIVQQAPAPVREVVAVVPAVTHTVADVVAQKPVTQVVKPIAQTVDTVVTELPVVGDVVTSPVVSDIVGSSPVQAITDPLTATVDGSLGAVTGGTVTVVDGAIPGATPGSGGVLPGLPGTPGAPGGAIDNGTSPGLGGQDASPAASSTAELRAQNADAALSVSPAFDASNAAFRPAAPVLAGLAAVSSGTSLAPFDAHPVPNHPGSPFGGAPFDGPDSPFGPAAPANGGGSGTGSSGSAGGPAAGGAPDSADFTFQADLLGRISHLTITDDLPSSPVFDSDVTPD